MTIEEFKEKLFKKLVDKKEFVDEDRPAFDKDFEEFDPTWVIFLEIINDVVEATKEECRVKPRSSRAKKKK